jgi:hypothetical protein
MTAKKTPRIKIAAHMNKALNTPEAATFLVNRCYTVNIVRVHWIVYKQRTGGAFKCIVKNLILGYF